MKKLVFIFVSALFFSMPVSAQEIMNYETVSSGDTVVETPTVAPSTVNPSMVSPAPVVTTSVHIADVTGMTEAEAIATLEEVVLPEGKQIEIIKSYAYSAEVPLDVVYEQSPVGEVSVSEAEKIYLSISMGPEPVEVLATAIEQQPVSTMNSFGIAAYIEPVEHETSAMLGIDWDSLPCSYEYNWDNSANCWYWGMYYGNECFKTPEGEYDVNVRHKMQLYCDGTNVYLHIVFATVYWDDVNGNDYRFTIDGQMSAFQLEYDDGRNITGKLDGLDVGTHQINVVHRNPWMSGQHVDGSLAYLTKYEDNRNAEIELMIPLEQFAYQNENVDIENIGTIEFFTYNLMYRSITASGASTFPLVTAGAALLVIPGSTVLLKRYGRKRKKEKESDGKSV